MNVFACLYQVGADPQYECIHHVVLGLISSRINLSLSGIHGGVYVLLEHLAISKTITLIFYSSRDLQADA